MKVVQKVSNGKCMKCQFVCKNDWFDERQGGSVSLLMLTDLTKCQYATNVIKHGWLNDKLCKFKYTALKSVKMGFFVIGY